MSRRVRTRPSAERDLVEQGRYFAMEAGPEVALRFLDAARATFERLARIPRMGRLWRSALPRLAGVRVFPVRGFEKHLVFYRPLEGEEGVEVLHVFHGARDMEALFEDEDDDGG